MTNFLTSWRFFWHHDVFMTLWRMCDVTNYWRHDVCCTYWRHNDNFDARNVLTTWRILLTSWHFLNSWLTLSLHFCRSDCIFSLFREQNIIKTCFWCYNELFLMSWHVFVVMTSSRIFDFMTNFLTSWRTFRTFDVFLTLWRVDVITCFWRHDKLVDDMAKVLMLWTFNVIMHITHLLRLWRHNHKLTT